MMKAALELWRRLRRTIQGADNYSSPGFRKYQVAPRLKTEEVRRRVARGLQNSWGEQKQHTRL